MHLVEHPLTVGSLLLVALLPVPAAAGQACGPGTSTTEVTFTTGSPATFVPWQDIAASLPQFDPALGTLLSATVTARVTNAIDALGENTSAAACNLAFTAGGSFDVEIVGAGVPNLLVVAQFAGSVPVGAFDGTVDFAGTSGFLQHQVAVSQTGTVVTDPVVLANTFTGLGLVNFLHDATLIAQAAGCATSAFDVTANGRLELTVAYLYCTAACIERNRRVCGSLLLYPEFDNRPGVVTMLTVTDACCDTSAGNRLVEFRFVDESTCLKTDQTFTLTPCDQLTFLTSAVNSGGINRRGYAYVYAKNSDLSPNNPTGTPIVWNHLIGQQLVLNGVSMVDYSMNAVSFRGIGEENEPNDDDGDGVRDLDGPGAFFAEYDEAPEAILIPRFLGQDDGQIASLGSKGPGASLFESEIILINLSGGSSFTTTVDILGFNDNEEPLSAQYTFFCWEKPRLSTFAPFTKEEFLDSLTDDPDEILGASHRESGWLSIDGLVANSSAETILDPAIYAVLVERVGAFAAADLPFERCSQDNGDLLPQGPFGDGPNPVVGDNQ